MHTLEFIIFSLVTFITIYAFIYAVYKKLQIIRLGAAENRFDHPGKRFANFCVNVLGQRKLLQTPYGVIHFFIFWGFIFILLGEIPFILERVFPTLAVPILGTNPYFYLLKDILSLLVFIGLIVGIIRRWIVRPARLYRTAEAAIIVVMIYGVIVTEWLTNGAALALEPHSAFALAPVYNWLAGFFAGSSPETIATSITFFWWIHVLILYGFMIYVPNSKHMHVLATPFNSFFATLKPTGGQIARMNLQDETLTEYGVGRVENFTWKQLLDSFACGECGRCMDNCPANLSGKPLNPKQLLSRTIKEHLLEKGSVMHKLNLKAMDEEGAAQAMTALHAMTAPRQIEEKKTLAQRLIGDVVSRDEIWACTTCMACEVLCPVSNEHVNKIIDMRRFEVMNENNYAPELQLAFRNVENKFNPWGVSWSERADWGKDLGVKTMKEAQDVEYLYWVGCAGSFDNRAKKVSQAVAKILQAAGVSFGILGREEKCCGDFIRRAGNEYLYEQMAEENVQILGNYNVKKIITTCPHCLNTFKNEYPAFGGNYEVIHHTQLIHELITTGKLSLNSQVEIPAQRIVYHDSCYLGRYQQEYTAPRALYKMVPGVELVEMDRHHDKSFCCGAGGSRMWLEEHLGERINNMRAEQALAKAPQAIGANCPYCITMLEDGIKDRVDSTDSTSIIPVLDPAELIVKLI